MFREAAAEPALCREHRVLRRGWIALAAIVPLLAHAEGQGPHRQPLTLLMLKGSHDKAEKILLASPWDAGIIIEGIDPNTAVPDKPGRAFATAAGYVAHGICATACVPRR